MATNIKKIITKFPFATIAVTSATLSVLATSFWAKAQQRPVPISVDIERNTKGGTGKRTDLFLDYEESSEKRPSPKV